MAEMMGLADKDVKTIVLSFFYRSKKMDRSEIMIKMEKRKILKKNPNGMYGDEKCII